LKTPRGSRARTGERNEDRAEMSHVRDESPDFQDDAKVISSESHNMPRWFRSTSQSSRSSDPEIAISWHRDVFVFLENFSNAQKETRLIPIVDLLNVLLFVSIEYQHREVHALDDRRLSLFNRDCVLKNPEGFNLTVSEHFLKACLLF
jgi:hypothetical protein